MKRGSIVVLVIAIIAMVIAGVFLVSKGNLIKRSTETQSSTVTTDWKTFRNTKLGYEVMYPSDWELRDEDNSGELYMLSGPKGSIEFQNESRIAPKAGQSIGDFLDTEPSPAKSMPTEKVLMGNNTVYLQKGVPNSGELGEATYLRVKHNDKYLNVVIIGAQYEDMLPVLQTLKFD